MKYGKNTYLVEEVIAYINNHRFFEQKENFNSKIKVINDFEEAVSYALEDETWTDIREQEMALVKREIYQIPNYQEFNNNLDDIDEVIENAIEDNLLDDYADAFNEVLTDFINISINRAINGMNSNFYEMLFDIYRAGGWPCGWDGDYPEGRIVVFFPNGE